MWNSSSGSALILYCLAGQFKWHDGPNLDCRPEFHTYGVEEEQIAVIISSNSSNLIWSAEWNRLFVRIQDLLAPRVIFYLLLNGSVWLYISEFSSLISLFFCIWCSCFWAVWMAIITLDYFFSPLISTTVALTEETPVIWEQTATRKVSVELPCPTWCVSIYCFLCPFIWGNVLYCPLADRWWDVMLTNPSHPLPQIVCPMEEDAPSPVSLCSAPPPLPPLPSVTPRYSSTRTPCCFLCRSCSLLLRPPSSFTTLFYHHWPSQSATLHEALKSGMGDICLISSCFSRPELITRF